MYNNNIHFSEMSDDVLLEYSVMAANLTGGSGNMFYYLFSVFMSCFTNFSDISKSFNLFEKPGSPLPSRILLTNFLFLGKFEYLLLEHVRVTVLHIK